MARVVDGKTLAFVRVTPGDGRSSFCRGGRRWSVDGSAALVSPELLAVLRAEKVLAVSTDAPELDGIDVALVEKFDLPVETHINEEAHALEQKHALELQIAAEKAKAEIDGLKEELKRLREKKPAAEAEKKHGK